MKKREFENNYVEIDVDKELFELEQEVLIQLDKYDVEFPGESEIMMTVDAIRPFVPVKENIWKTSYEHLSVIVKHSAYEVFHFSPIFWITNSLLLVISLIAIFSVELNPYLAMLFLAPLPTIAGLVEVLRSKNNGMAELEMSLKFSWQELIISKMLVIGGFNLLINIIFTISISVLYPEIWIWKVTLYWLTPFTVISAVSLVIVSKFRQMHMVTGTLTIWVVISTLVSQTTIIEHIENLPATFYILVTAFASAFSIIKMIQIYKRGISYEFNH
ncbi:hypothetical protein [Cytobacillus oceanisediminis]|uniref:hypothetical protein n=1 Tax=Cytobacillus oceanisediminis TaxID=665099 RepID=UPI00254BF5A4|nr:hypothetical protein [Cytobacillus oceanisediminis]MDK7669161.1 hypothetical protein [Cytobacillus oceanisediminis]